MGKCPYCSLRTSDSNDHVFPDFLGGIKTIPACKECNDRFGYSFEAAVSKNLAPIIVCLSFSGYKHKRKVSFDSAILDLSSGLEYHLNSSGEARLTKPHFIREGGEIKQVIARSAREASEIALSLQAKGKVKSFKTKSETKELYRPPLKNFQLQIGTELRQLAIKMCVAVGNIVCPEIRIMDESSQKFLLSKEPISSDVRLMWGTYPSLDNLRPPLAHVVYIEGNARTGQCFGVVQFFGGAVQLYVPLNKTFRGSAFAGLGILDITNFKEQFTQIDPLALPETPKIQPTEQVAHYQSTWGDVFNGQVSTAFGKAAVLFGINPRQRMNGFSIPLLWIEHPINFTADITLAPDANSNKDLSIPSDPRTWIISNDYGKTRFDVYNSFVGKWSQNLLNRDIGKVNTFTPDGLEGARLLLGTDFWCPIETLTFSYTVKTQGWLGAVRMNEIFMERATEGELRLEGSFDPQILPTHRDVSWPDVDDPQAVKERSHELIVVEVWDISLDSMSFDLPHWEVK